MSFSGQCWMPGKGTDLKARDGHFGVAEADPQLGGNHWLLPSLRIRRCNGAGAASAFFTTPRPWLLGLSVGLIGVPDAGVDFREQPDYGARCTAVSSGYCSTVPVQQPNA
jgi:hypothetical protein